MKIYQNAETNVYGSRSGWPGLVAIHQRENAFRDKYERYLSATPFDVDRKRKWLTAVAESARVAMPS